MREAAVKDGRRKQASETSRNLNVGIAKDDASEQVPADAPESKEIVEELIRRRQRIADDDDRLGLGQIRCLNLGDHAGEILVGVWRQNPTLVARPEHQGLLQRHCNDGPHRRRESLNSSVPSVPRVRRMRPISNRPKTFSILNTSMYALAWPACREARARRTSSKSSAAAPTRPCRCSRFATSRNWSISGPPASAEAPAPRMNTVRAIGPS